MFDMLAMPDHPWMYLTAVDFGIQVRLIVKTVTQPALTFVCSGAVGR